MSISVSSGAQAGVVPVLRYRNVEEAVSWLSRAFGFEESRFVKDAEGKARYAQLAWRDSMIMLCPLGGSAFDACMAQPSETGGCETQIAYVFVDDVEAHKARAVAAGAEIVLDMVGGDGRGQGYSCRDIEGHIWSFGTYDPWRHVTPRLGEPAASPGRRVAGIGLMGLVVAATLTAGYMHFSPAQGRPSATLANIDAVLEKPADLESAERLLRQTREELMRERAQRMLAERAVQDSKDASSREREARVNAEKSAADARKALADKTDLLAKAEKAAVDRPAAAPIVAVSAAPQAVAGIQAAKACDTEAEARALRTASLATSAANDEIAALKVAVERAQAELTQERQKGQRLTSSGDLRGEIERERAGRDRAERQLRDALARLARLDGNRKPQDPSAPPPKMDSGYYKDLSQEIFPLPGMIRY